MTRVRMKMRGMSIHYHHLVSINIELQKCQQTIGLIFTSINYQITGTTIFGIHGKPKVPTPTNNRTLLCLYATPA